MEKERGVVFFFEREKGREEEGERETLASMRVSRDEMGVPNFSSNKTGLHWFARSVIAWLWDDFLS